MLSLGDQAAGLRVGLPQEDDSRTQPMMSAIRGVRSIAVTSGKGGVGKTQLVANLAIAAARQGLRVVVFDADLGLASLDLMLGVRPTLDMRNVLRGDCRMIDAVTKGPAGVHLLPACPGRYDMANLSLVERRQIIEGLSEISVSYDLLIIDTPAGIGSNTVTFACAEEVLLVATPDPTSLRDAYAMVKVLHRRGGVQRIQLIANQVGSQLEGYSLHERMNDIVQRFLPVDLQYIGCIPFDRHVVQAVRSGAPYVLHVPESPASQAVGRILQKLTQNVSLRPLC